MNDRILVTGSRGQLGTELRKLLPEAVYADVNELDITDAAAVGSFVRDNQIAAIVNCAAYTAVDRAEDEEELAYRINAAGPGNLAKTGCRLIHISTDYVFDGNSSVPYTPDAPPCPLSAYGRTKLAGEKLVLENNPRAVIIRTAWLYSSHGNNFVKTMRMLGSTREAVNVVNDQIGTPTFAGDLADAIVRILPEVSEENAGIYHYTNEGVCSWYDFSYEIMSLSGYDCKVNPVPSSEYPVRAHRPHYSVLDKNLIKKVFRIDIPYWKESLKKCLSQF
ncbi:dTDP-4-dehydrorhamnose reductase [Succinimonas amylolytica]|uniref:dTDP-4-dehydrorhamnose reductase n=1 Tax=Succinimonas amylolytica TaxID=83769 RepID=UPI00035E10FF|nr:dTDP-4-dehydrorhamnose reductase [Succinimonas amylolytica]